MAMEELRRPSTWIRWSRVAPAPGPAMQEKESWDALKGEQRREVKLFVTTAISEVFVPKLDPEKERRVVPSVETVEGKCEM